MRLRRYLNFLLLCLLFLNCGGSDNQKRSITTTIGPQGGVANGPGSAYLSIPEGSLSTSVEITFERVFDLPEPDNAIRIGEFYSINPQGTHLEKEATMVLPFNAADVPAGYGIRIAVLSEGKWTTIQAKIVFGLLQISIDRFASYTPVAIKGASTDDSAVGDDDVIPTDDSLNTDEKTD